MTSRFFHESVSPPALEYPIGLFQSFTKIHRDIHNFVFIEYCDKFSLMSLLPVLVINIGDYTLSRIFIRSMTLAINLSSETMTPANNLLPVSTTTGDKTVDQIGYQSAYTL